MELSCNFVAFAFVHVGFEYPWFHLIINWCIRIQHICLGYLWSVTRSGSCQVSVWSIRTPRSGSLLHSYLVVRGCLSWSRFSWVGNLLLNTRDYFHDILEIFDQESHFFRVG